MDGTLFRPLAESEVYCNGRAKLTPDGEVLECVWASRPVFRCRAVEAREKKKGPGAGGAGEGGGRGAVRARKRLWELCRCNHFDLFVTLTLSPQEVDRYDMGEITRRLNVWLDNRVRRRGLRYVLVPERHRDGAVHFHGLCNSEALRLVPSGHRDRAGREVFNVADWTLGFTTAVRLDENYERVCNYVSKYITKQYDAGHESGQFSDTSEAKTGPIGGRWFYHGGALAEPVVKYFDLESRPDSGREYKVEEAGLILVYMTERQPKEGGK